MHHNKKGMRVAEIKIKEEKVEEDGVFTHRRHAHLTRSLEMPYSLGNIGSRKQASHKGGALGQSPEERRSLKQQTLAGKLSPHECT